MTKVAGELLRGGSESIRTNKKLVATVKKALREAGFPSGCIEFIDTTDRSAVLELTSTKFVVCGNGNIKK